MVTSLWSALCCRAVTQCVPENDSLPLGRTPYHRCPLCRAGSFADECVADCTHHERYQRGLPPKIRWVRCQGCQHVFTDGYFSGEALALLFSTTDEGQDPAAAPTMESQHWSRGCAADIVDKIRRLIPGDRFRWLDVGIGNGTLLTTAAEYGHEVVGLDLRRRTVDAMRQAGFEVHRTPVEELEVRERFDVVSMADVLEHTPFPGTTLEAVHRALKSGGALFLSMPNIDSFAWKQASSAGINPFWGELEHFHNFGYARLKSLLREHGFRCVDYGVSRRYYCSMEVVAVAEASG